MRKRPQKSRNQIPRKKLYLSTILRLKQNKRRIYLGIKFISKAKSKQRKRAMTKLRQRSKKKL